MDKRELKIDYFVCRNSVPAGYEELSEKALAAAGKAYCIYSGFAVGAAVLLENGTIVLGNNQENVAYAKPGKECLYNIFIMEELQSILALGSGGSSKIVFPEENRMERVENVKSVDDYIGRIDEMIRRKKESWR